MTNAAAELMPCDIFVGMKASFTEKVSSEFINAFSQLSGDWNPLHNDSSYSDALSLRGRVAHGAIQQALISRLVGMQLPGKYCVIQKLSTQYLQMVIEGESLTVEGEVTTWDPSIPAGKIRVRITCEGSTKSLSLVDVGMVGVPKPGKPELKVVPARKENLSSETTVFFGASSGLAKSLFPVLSAKGKKVLRSSRSRSDFDFDWNTEDPSRLLDWLEQENPHSIVLFASLPPKKSLPSQIDLEYLSQNLLIHLLPLKSIAQATAQGKLKALKRIVVLGSAGARHLYPEQGFEAYAYTKTLSSYYIKDLARELSTKGISVNLVSPTELSVGMTAGMSEKAKALKALKNPSGQLTSVEDVASVILTLLSDDSSAITGHEIVLAGGR